VIANTNPNTNTARPRVDHPALRFDPSHPVPVAFAAAQLSLHPDILSILLARTADVPLRTKPSIPSAARA
jgi:hypothetical protein